MRIKIIIPYFGHRPAWMDYLLQTCAFNASVRWLFYTNCQEPAEAPTNVSFVSHTIDDFNTLASDKLDLHIEITHPYKICDLRPAFGHIFSDHLKGYDFWGYADMDLVFGNIKSFLPDELLKNHDVISVREGYLAGHFALYKNTPSINGLYKKSSSYKKIFQDALHHYAFDERSSLLGKKVHSIYGTRGQRWISQQMDSLARRARLIMRPALKNTEFPDMTSITQNLSASGMIKLHQRDLVRSDLWYEKQHIRHWEIAWKDGILRDTNTGQEFLHFHFIKSKGTRTFHIESFRPGAEFRISRTGIKPLQDPV